MAVISLSEPAAAEQQKNIYNSNVGGTLNRRSQFTVPAGVSWAVVGCVVADVVAESDITDTLVPAIEALAEVTSVNGDQVFGQIPATVEAADHECVLHVSSIMSMQIGTGDTFTQTQKNHESIKPPVGKKWFVAVLRVPEALDATKIAALEAAITGITGITTTEHLIDGTVSSRASGNASLSVACHMRIDATEA